MISFFLLGALAIQETIMKILRETTVRFVDNKYLPTDNRDNSAPLIVR